MSEKIKSGTDVNVLCYSSFVVPLVKGTQEQQQIIEDLLKKIERLEKMVEPMRK